MNLNRTPTVEQLADLVRPCNDRKGNHVLWVAKSGEVAITCIPVDQSAEEFEQAHPDLQLRVETFLRGNEYVGPDAANDLEFLAELLERLTQAWSQSQGQPESAYLALW